MTVNELLNRLDRECMSVASNETILSWLNSIEQAVYREVILTHEGYSDVEHCHDLTKADGDTVLTVPDAFCELYIRYITMKCQLKTHDISRYNNEAALFAAAYRDFSDCYNRTHLPLKKVSHFNV